MNELLWWFGQNSLAALLMIPCVMIACQLFRDRPAVQHLLWLVILVKFVTPPIIVWPWSVEELRSMAWLPKPAALVATNESASQVPQLEHTEASLWQSETPFSPGESDPYSDPIAPLASESVFAVARLEVALPQWKQITGFTLLTVWFIGAVVCLVNQIRRLMCYGRIVRRGDIAPLHLHQEVASVASRLRMKPPICMVVERIASPFVWCLGTIRLAWPDSLASPDDVANSRGIIAHELAHLRRRDHWITWLELGAGILWWWNPLFWFAQRRLRETAEMSCDAMAIRANPESRGGYAELLLNLSSHSTSGIPAPALGVGAGNAGSFERRLKMILSTSVSGELSLRGALATGFLAIAALPYWSLAQSATLGSDPILRIQESAGEDAKVAKPAPTIAPQSYQEETTRASQIQWGEPVEGLRLGIRPSVFAKQATRFRWGDWIRYDVLLKNESDRTIVVPRDPRDLIGPASSGDSVNLSVEKGWMSFDVPQKELDKAKLVLLPGESGFLHSAQAQILASQAERRRYGPEPLRLQLGQFPVFAESDVYFTSDDADSRGRSIRLRSATSKIEVLPEARFEMHQLSKKNTVDLSESERRVDVSSVNGVSETLVADLASECRIDEDDCLSVTAIASAGNPVKYSVLLTLRPSGVRRMQRTIGYATGEPPSQLPYGIFADGELLSSTQLKNPNPDNPIVLASGLTQQRAEKIVTKIRKILPQPAVNDQSALNAPPADRD